MSYAAIATYYAVEFVMRRDQIRTAIVQTRLTEQEKTDFLAAAAASGTRSRWNAPSPSEVLRELAIEFTKRNLPKS
jgi:hypothetical protein